MIAAILGLPAEVNFLSLTIDENLNMKAFARGASVDKPFSANSVPYNWMSETPAPPAASVTPETPAPTEPFTPTAAIIITDYVVPIAEEITEADPEIVSIGAED